MKNLTLILLLLVSSFTFSQQYEYKIISVIESVVPNGLGRSRMLSETQPVDYKSATTIRTEEGKQKSDKSRSEIRTKVFEETKLLNFYNIGGIRFNNIATNDALITAKLNDEAAKGWVLSFVTSGVESSGDKDKIGIYATRFILRREVK
jgi:hypothetical protein|tara:strand:+ start:743 stop:1189 length:447 start_codon:yes stop_codon:yes gene_type:complete